MTLNMTYRQTCSLSQHHPLLHSSKFLTTSRQCLTSLTFRAGTVYKCLKEKHGGSGGTQRPMEYEWEWRVSFHMFQNTKAAHGTKACGKIKPWVFERATQCSTQCNQPNGTRMLLFTERGIKVCSDMPSFWERPLGVPGQKTLQSRHCARRGWKSQL